MFTNKVLNILLSIIAIPQIPIQFVTIFVLGLLITISFGLLLIPLTAIWIIIFLGPLLALSYLHERFVIIRPLTGIFGICVAIIGDIYVALIPSMGEKESRFEKLILCQTFPYSWSYFQLTKGKNVIKNDDNLTKVLREVSKAQAINGYLDNLRADIVSRPYYVTSDYNLDW